MNKKIKRIFKRIDNKPFDPLWYRLRQLENTKILYEQNLNLPANVRIANVQLIQNDIVALKRKLSKRTKIRPLILDRI